ncbi:MAG: D-amino-acid transaminase [Clostridiales bacterium]|jgi:D-alanine transaminase|nr:D-amino-acid transaminase [Clostridiales bacterium]
MARIDTFLNGKFLPVHEANVNIEDRGILFGDGVYEVIQVYHGRLFQANEHLNRLWRSAAEIELPLPYDRGEMLQLMVELVRVSNVYDGGLYLEITRGVAVRVHQFPENCKPTFFMIARDAKPLEDSVYTQGVQVTLLPDERWKRCDIKTLNLLPNVLAKEKAVRLGFFDAFFFSERGITEATSSSVLVVFNGELVTAPQGYWILPGITRDTVIDLARQLNIPVRRDFISKDEIFKATEVMLTNTRVNIVPVVSIDGVTINNGQPGEIYKQLAHAFKALLEAT